MNITIEDIAKKAGVSIATVSRVLNDSKPVSPDLRKRVNKVIEKTSYKPNALARGLKKKETRLIGVIIPDIANQTFAELIHGIEGLASANGFDIIVSHSNGLIDKELEIFDVFREKQIDGIIFSGVSFTEKHRDFLNKYKIPTVIVGQDATGMNLLSVAINNFQASYEATTYLIELGHRRIAMITGPLEDKAAGLDRYRGFSFACSEHGIKEREEYIENGDFTYESGYEEMSKICESEELPTALFAASDKMAVGAMNYCIDNGIKVPGKISIMGFDNMELAQEVRPTLTTVHQEQRDVGRIATENLLQKIREGGEKNIHIQPSYRIVQRNSTRNICQE